MTRGNPACKRVRILLGAFVLGGLEGQHEALVRTHLAGCGRCRAEYEELAEVPPLLDMITAEEAAGAEKLPPET
jgi:predicted anti-sigma-YlaC factor YlaD